MSGDSNLNLLSPVAAAAGDESREKAGEEKKEKKKKQEEEVVEKGYSKREGEKRENDQRRRQQQQPREGGEWGFFDSRCVEEDGAELEGDYHEIYAMLKECNMDPNETVNRLLSQVSGGEVKSKREKKKEVKESTESRSRGASSASNRGSRGGTDRNTVRGGSAQYSSNESGSMRSKAAYKKENGASATLNSSLTSGAAGQNTNRKSMSQSESVPAEGTVQAIFTADNIPLSSQPSSGFQPAWVGAPGQISMADIVRMGRPRVSIAPFAANETSYPQHSSSVSNASQHIVKNPPISGHLPPESLHDLNSTEDSASQVSETIPEQGVAISQHISHDEWPFVEQSSAASGSSVVDPAGSSAYADLSSSSNVHVDRTDLHLNSHLDEVQFTEGIANFKRDSSDRQLQQDNSGGASHFDNSSFEKRSSYQPQRLAFEHPEGNPLEFPLNLQF
ncbi:hypothetical protein ACLOJK_037311 [Asimina triloba]